MLRDTAIARIQRGLGFRTDLVETIAEAMQEQQRLLEMGKSLPWFLLEEDQTIPVAAGTRSYALPTGWLRQPEDSSIWYTDSDGKEVKLAKTPYDEGRDYYYGADASQPSAYALRKASIYIFPEPDAAYTLTWDYYKRGTLLSSNIENAWLQYAPELLIGAAGISIATDLRDATAVQTFTALYATAQQNLINEMAAREENSMPRALGRNN